MNARNRTGWKTIAWVVMFAGWLGMAGSVFGAGPWYVATNGVPGNGLSWAQAFTNLQQAINAAADGETIYVAGHTFTNNTTTQLNSQLVWTNKGLTILGGYAADVGTPDALTNTPTVLTQPAGGTSRILYIGAVTNGTLQNVTIAGGNLTGNANGGGILITNCASLTITACTIVSNTVNIVLNAAGGGLYVTGGNLVLTNCTVVKNRVIAANQNLSYGGGIYLAFGVLSLRDTVLDSNRAQYGTNPNGGKSLGGGMYVNAGTGTVVNCLLYNNDAGYLYSSDTSQTAPDVLVTGSGDGIYVNGGVLQVNSTTVACHPDDGIYRNGGTVTVTNSILWYNYDDLVGVPAANLSYSDIQTGDNNGTNGCISADPLFEYGFYLNANSPCVNTGSVTATTVGLDSRTTRTDGQADSGASLLDLGYHYPTGFDLTYADVYVATNGTDGNSGTNALQPFGTLTKAFAMARNGTRIHVAACQYTTNAASFPLTLEDKIGFQLLGTNSAATVINAAGANQRILTLDYIGGVCRIEGITFAGGKQTAASPGQYGGTQGGGIWINNCSDVTMASCTLTNNTVAPAGGMSYGGAMYVYGSRVAMTNCLVVKNTCTGGNQASAFSGGIYFLGRMLTVRNSVFDGNYTTYGTNPNGGQYVAGGALYVSYGSAWLVNCLLNNNDAYAVLSTARGDGIYVRSGVLNANSCTIAGNFGEGVYRNSGSVGITNSILWDNSDDLLNVPAIGLSYCDIQTGDNNGTNGCFSADPLFSGGYYLDTISPCRDIGNMTASAAGLSNRTTSIDGTPDTGVLDLGYHYATAVAGVVYDHLYVVPAPAGNDGNIGTNISQPLATLTKAFSLAGSGTRVHIGAGVYTNGAETFPLIISLQNGVKLVGTNRAVTVIRATGSTRRVLTMDRLSGTCRPKTAGDFHET